MTAKVSVARWEPALRGRLGLVAGIAFVALLCRLALDEDLAWGLWGRVGCAILVLSMTRWPYGSLSLLIGTSVMPRFFVELFGWKARPEHFAAALVFIVASIWLLAGKRRLHLEKLDYCVLAYVGINYISSAFTSS